MPYLKHWYWKEGVKGLHSSVMEVKEITTEEYADLHVIKVAATFGVCLSLLNCLAHLAFGPYDNDRHGGMGKAVSHADVSPSTIHLGSRQTYLLTLPTPIPIPIFCHAFRPLVPTTTESGRYKAMRRSSVSVIFPGIYSRINDS